MNYRSMKHCTAALLYTSALALTLTQAVVAQGPQAAPPGPPPPARAIAPIDLTGYWVSIVTEDWQYRMLIPDKGDFNSVPLNAAGRALGNAWDPVKDRPGPEQCKAYGAGGMMRIPQRLHITWQDPQTLKLETDAGRQTRIFHFTAKPPVDVAPTLQGYSVASWQGLRPGPPILVQGQQQGTVNAAVGGGTKPEGYLKSVTSHVLPGYLRLNGAPYSADAVVEDYFDSFTEPDGITWLVVTTVVTDPTYLARPFIVSTHFKKQADATGWLPSACGENYR